MTTDLDALRAEYERTGLDVGDVDPDPFAQVARWMQDWEAAAPNEPSAVILATAGGDGRPSARTVLMRGFDRRGCTFFTSYDSRKGQDLTANPHGALLFSWVPLLRQVHLRGPVERVARQESEAYFATRPRGSQLAAWASHQSSVLTDRAELEARFADGDGPVRGRGGAVPAVLGRLPPGARGDRAVAGPSQPDARPPSLRARRDERRTPGASSASARESVACSGRRFAPASASASRRPAKPAASGPATSRTATLGRRR